MFVYKIQTLKVQNTNISGYIYIFLVDISNMPWCTFMIDDFKDDRTLNMVFGIVIYCKCYKPRRLPKTNQEQTDNYCKSLKMITERIEVRLIVKLRSGK